MTLLLLLLLVLLRWVLRIYLYLLWARVIVDWWRVLQPRFQPRGLVLILFEAVFTVTDPPIKLVRRVLPPIRLGHLALDLGVMVTMFCCWLALVLLAAVG